MNAVKGIATCISSNNAFTRTLPYGTALRVEYQKRKERNDPIKIKTRLKIASLSTQDNVCAMNEFSRIWNFKLVTCAKDE